MPISIQTLASDLDGTLIPLAGSEGHVEALRELQSFLELQQINLWFVTGRSWSLTRQAIQDHQLPLPQYAICDVGTRILERVEGDSRDSDSRDSDFRELDAYARCMADLLGEWSAERVQESIRGLGTAMTEQPREKQTPFKISYDYPIDEKSVVTQRVADWIQSSDVPLSMVSSRCVDTGGGLLDLLPKAVDKSFGLKWLRDRKSLQDNEIVFAGDSGNDAAAFACGVSAILVANADEQLKAATREMEPSRIYRARNESTSGVLEGLQHFVNGKQ